MRAYLCLKSQVNGTKYYFMYFLDNKEELLGGWFIIDREKMTYEPESDSEVLNQIKNYKKSGNVETFEVWEDNYFVHKVELVTEPTQTTVTFIHKSEQGEERTPTQIIGSEAEWEKAYEAKYGKKPSGGDASSDSPTSGLTNAKDKVTGGVKSRCIPFEEENLSDKCVCCGKEAKNTVVWGIQY